MPSYTIKKNMVSVVRDYHVRDEQDATVFEIDGKVRFARTFDVKDRTGRILCSAKEKLLSIDPTFLIDAPGASQVTMRRTTTSSVYPMKFDIAVDGESRMRAQVTAFGDDAVVMRGPARVATVSRQPNTLVTEIFHLWTADDENPALMLAIAMVIVEGDALRAATT